MVGQKNAGDEEPNAVRSGCPREWRYQSVLLQDHHGVHVPSDQAHFAHGSHARAVFLSDRREVSVWRRQGDH